MYGYSKRERIVLAIKVAAITLAGVAVVVGATASFWSSLPGQYH